MNKIKIAWITGDYFIDVDFMLVPYIKEHYKDYVDVKWIVIRSFSSNITINSELDCDVITSKYRNKDPRVIWEYYKIFRSIKKDVDIIYSDFVGVPFYYPTLLNSVKKTPIIHAAHNVKPYSASYKDAWPIELRIGVKYVFEHNRYFQLFSKSTYEYFKSVYPDKSIFYCPMTMKGYGKVRTDNYSIDSTKINFLFFGNVMGNKRLDLLIDAIKELPKHIQNKIHLTVAGKCINSDIFKKQIGNCDCISTYFKRIDDDEIPELFTKHHFLMLPYEAVAQSGPHMIAYYYDLPVIASDIEGFNERLINGCNGFLFQVNNKESLKQVIIKVSNMSADEYLNMKRNLHIYAQENFGLASIADRYIKYFNSIINDQK